MSVECHMVEIALKWKWMLPSRRYVAETMDMRRNLSAAHKKMWRRARQPGRWRCLRRQQQRKGRCGEEEKIVTNGTNVRNKWRKHVLRSDNECNWCACESCRVSAFFCRSHKYIRIESQTEGETWKWWQLHFSFQWINVYFQFGSAYMFVCVGLCCESR